MGAEVYEEQASIYVYSGIGYPSEVRKTNRRSTSDVYQTILKPDDLRNMVLQLVLLYEDQFGLQLPAINHRLLLFDFIMQLALPSKFLSV